MSSFPAAAFTKDNVKARWLAPYGSEELNKKALGEPRGVYVGATPSAVGDLLSLLVDTTEGHTSIQIISSTSLAMITLTTEETIQLDFTGHTSFPVYVVAKANYQINAVSSATVETQLVAPNGRTEIGVCRVDSLSPMVIVTDPTVDAAARQRPFARSFQPFGYMPGGSVEDLEAATTSTAEVIAARTDTVAFVHPNLSDRLTADFTPARVAGNMGRESDLIQGNDYVTIGNSQRMSSSFAKSSRTVKPDLDIIPGGSETITGAITEIVVGSGTSDTVRNIVNIVDVSNGQRLIDKANGRPVFGRILSDEILIPAALTFDITNTVGTSINVSANVETGDLIEDLDGVYQEVVSVSAINIVMTSSNTGTTGVSAVGAQGRRRFTTNLLTKSGGVETAHTIIREVAIGPITVATRFQVGETITYNVKTGIVVRDTPVGATTLLYIPNVETAIVLAAETIVGGLSGAQATAPTITNVAPTLRYFFPMFMTVVNL